MMNRLRPVRFPPLQGAFRQSRNRSQGVAHAPRNPLFAPRFPCEHPHPPRERGWGEGGEGYGMPLLRKLYFRCASFKPSGCVAVPCNMGSAAARSVSAGRQRLPGRDRWRPRLGETGHQTAAACQPDQADERAAGARAGTVRRHRQRQPCGRPRDRIASQTKGGRTFFRTRPAHRHLAAIGERRLPCAGRPPCRQ